MQVCAIALKAVKIKADYHRTAAANTQADLEQAWATLSPEDQAHINAICNRESPPDLDAIATLITKCDNILQLQALKAQHGEDVVRAAWKLLPIDERLRLKAICDGFQLRSDSTAVTDKPKQPKRSLFNISDDLEKLNELLDECSDDAQQQELITQWLEQLGDERDRKLDNYCALITEMLARAEVRKAEAKRMQELAASDENRAKLLKDRLMWFFQTHNLKTVETARYKLSLAKNSTRPLIVDPDVTPTQLPEQFQKVSVEVNTTAIREALKQGEELPFARLGESGHHIRIR